jgi:hypothetical protein
MQDIFITSIKINKVRHLEKLEITLYEDENRRRRIPLDGTEKLSHLDYS